MTVARKIGVGLAVLVLLILLALVALWLSIESLAKAGIERGGAYALDVPTTVDDVSIGLVSGRFGIQDLTVANPPGYTLGDHFLRLGAATLELPLGELTQDTVTVPRLELRDLDLVLEKRGRQANYDVILANLKRFESQGGADPGQSPAGEGKRFVVREIVLRNITVHPYLVQVGEAQPRPVKVPPIREVRFTYDSSQGLDIAQLTNLILKIALESVAANLGELLPGVMLDGLGEGLRQLAAVDQLGEAVLGSAEQIVGEAGKQAGQAVRGMGEVIQDGGDLGQAADEVGKTVDEVGKKLGEGLGGLFDPKKNEDKSKSK